jgi:hypothetical protein
MSENAAPADDLVLRDEDAENVTGGRKKSKRSSLKAKTAAVTQSETAGPTVVSYPGPYPPSNPDQPDEVTFTPDDC